MARSIWLVLSAAALVCAAHGCEGDDGGDTPSTTTGVGGSGGQAGSEAGGQGGTATGAGGSASGGAGGAAGAAAGGSSMGGGGGGAGPPAHACPPEGSLDCSPGPGSAEPDDCGDGTSCFLSNVQSAISRTINDHSSWFTWDDVHSCWSILEIDLFLNAVVTDLEAHNRCAIRDPNAYMEEITVKFNNDYAESFDIVSSANCARQGSGSYTGYCAPAWW